MGGMNEYTAEQLASIAGGLSWNMKHAIRRGFNGRLAYSTQRATARALVKRGLVDHDGVTLTERGLLVREHLKVRATTEVVR